MLAVCYIPSEFSSCGRGAEETLQLLAEDVEKFGSQGPLMSYVDEHSEGVPLQKVIDEVKNSQGKDFVDFLKGVNMVVVNGRKGRDAYTCVSGKGCSVVDYCLVENEKFSMIESFKVTNMSESVEKMGCKGVVTRIPDHSLLPWEMSLKA